VLLKLLLAIVVYYTLAFGIYAWNDALLYGNAIHQARIALRKQQQEATKGSASAPWARLNQVTHAATTRLTFDFIVTVMIALYAWWCLGRAIARGVPIIPSGD